jgi:hypothetical protein
MPSVFTREICSLVYILASGGLSDGASQFPVTERI